DRRRAANELRVAPVKIRDATQTPQHIAKMAAKNSAVGVKLIDHNIPKVFEQARPACMVWKNASVQHVRIREHHMALFSDGSAGVGGRVTVIGEDAETVIEPLVKVIEFRQLILRKSLGGEEIQRARVRSFEDGIQDRQVVAKSFSGSGWSDYHDILARVDGFGSDSLMRVQLANALGTIRRDEVRVDPCRELSPLGFARREVTHCG